ncbi:MAG: dCTP deaminase [Pirellulales bacterium]|nr:dCTP deaminase [Pirellulales bacterium]
MGLLSRAAIQRRIADGSLLIDPPPLAGDYDSDSVDVHLGNKVYEWLQPATGTTLTISLHKKQQQFSYREFAKTYLREVPVDNSGIITLRPHTFYLADLRQHTTLPSDLAMHIQGKSSLARLGVLVHLTAPHAHAGWKGRLALEIYNLGPFNIELTPEIVIGQLTFWKVEEPESQPDETPKQFDNQQTARGEN